MLTRYRFQPGWTTSILFVVLLPTLIGLGMWQLDRAAEKTTIRDRVLSRGQMSPVNINRVRIDPDSMDYRRATVRGRYREALTIYLDNKVLDGVPGYEVLTPLVIETSDRAILVNRGWVPWGESRQNLPAVDTPDDVVMLAGRLRKPPEEYFALEAPRETFEPRWQNLDIARYRAVTGVPVAPVVLALSPGDARDESLVRRPLQYDDSWIERHRAYAVQWFALALTLAVLYVVLNLKKRDRDD